MGEGEMKDERGMVMEVKFVIHIKNLGGSLMFVFISAGILVCLVAVRVMEVEVVECLEVNFRLVGDGIFNLGGDFMVVLVEKHMKHLKLGMEYAARLVWSSLSGRIYFLWRLSLMSTDLSSVW